MEQINDYHSYTQLMRNGFYDKLFFIDKLFGPWRTLVDYGCADGFLTKLIAVIFPEKQIIGFDNDPDMLLRAQFGGGISSNVRFTHDIDEIHNGDILFLSSVLHEIYSYKSAEDITTFWSHVFAENRKYIIIRDMSFNGSAIAPNNRISSSMLNPLRTWCEDNHVRGELIRFEEHFGSIENPKSFMHFLLKYQYTTSPNWLREVHENYFGFDVNHFIKSIPEGWQIDHYEKYSLPYLKSKWRMELGIDPSLTTHFKLILTKE
jgi:SAM-dependent methyltransferase